MEYKIEGVIITDLRKIFNEKGDVYHGLKKREISFLNLEKLLFFIKFGEIKAWKKHRKMICNLTVPVGEVGCLTI